MKKTFPVKSMIDTVNSQLAVPLKTLQEIYQFDEAQAAAWREAYCDCLSSILHQCDVYAGFRHLNPDDCDFGTPGYYAREYFTSFKIK
jgi:hypothetical protein